MSFNDIINIIKRYLDSFIYYLPIDRRDWQIDWSKAINLSYLLEPNVGGRFKFYPQLVLLFSLLIISSIFFYRKMRFVKDNPPKRRFFKRLVILTSLSSLLGFLYLFSRFENLSFLSSRIILVLILFFFLVGGIRLSLFYVRSLSREERDHVAFLLRQKYLPKRRKR